MRTTNILIPQQEVINMTSLSSTTIWRLEKNGLFPKRHKIGPTRVAWLKADILDWIASKTTGGNNDTK